MPRVFKPEGALKDACYQVLTEILTPVHYADLTKLAFNRLSANPSEFDWRKQTERVRERLPEYKDIRYAGNPLCFMFFEYWFAGPQIHLFNPDAIRIPINSKSTKNGILEAKLRIPYLLYKGGRVTKKQLYQTARNGFVLENNVVDWFKSKWPSMILDADNKGVWHRGCDHDFKIQDLLSGYAYKFDVQGPNFRGEYNSPKGKPKTDYHIQCKFENSVILIESICTGRQLKKANKVIPVQNISPLRLIVWLNCLSNSIDYYALVTSLIII